MIWKTALEGWRSSWAGKGLVELKQTQSRLPVFRNAGLGHILWKHNGDPEPSQNQSHTILKSRLSLDFFFFSRKASTFKLKAMPVLLSSPHVWDLATHTFKQQMGTIWMCAHSWNQQILKSAYGIILNLYQLSKILEWFLITEDCVVICSFIPAGTVPGTEGVNKA